MALSVNAAVVLALIVVIATMFMVAYIHSVYTKDVHTIEGYSNKTGKKSEPKFPVSDFTYQYIKDNTSVAQQNSLYGKMHVMTPDERRVARKQPTVITGTVIDVAPSFRSTWSFS